MIGPLTDVLEARCVVVASGLPVGLPVGLYIYIYI